MANNYQSVQSGLAELKIFYQGPIVDQFNEEMALWRGSEKGKFAWSGSQVNRPLRVRRNPGVGATSDGGNLPNIGRQTTVQAVIAAKYNYLRFGITGPMIKASKSDVGSFVRSAAYELQMGYEDLKSSCNRQMSWNGNGTMAQIASAAVATTSITISGRESVEPALKFIDVGTCVDVYNGSTLVVAGVTVLAITSGTLSSSQATITVDTPVTASAGFVLVQSGSYGQEIQGILTQLDGATSTVFGIDRSLYVQSQGNVIDVGALPLSIDVMQRLQDETERRGGAGVNAIFCDYSTRRMYQKLLTPDKRYSNTVKGDGGFSNKNENYLEFNGIPLVADKDCPVRLFMLPEKQIEKYVLSEMEFADETGSMYIPTPDQDQLEVRIRFFANMFNSKAAGSGVLTNYVSP